MLLLQLLRDYCYFLRRMMSCMVCWSRGVDMCLSAQAYDCRSGYIDVSTLVRQHQRSFTYIFDHCWVGALLELEQDNVYDRHLDMTDQRSSIRDTS